MFKSNKIISKFLIENPGYLKSSVDILHNRLKINGLGNFNKIDIQNSLKEVRKLNKVKSKLFKRINNKELSKVLKEPVKTPKKVFKRLFFDIETSFNIVGTWNVGYKLNIGPENIIKERAIICVSYKWAGDSKTHCLSWNRGDDKQLLLNFIKVLNEADEVIGHNSDRFDIKWLRTRCLYHGIPMFPTYQSVDTLKLARNGFKFNSNKLDYLGKFFGFGGKKDTGGLKLWHQIIFDNDPKAMKLMMEYCDNDVILLEKVFNKLNPYTKHKTHVGVLLGGNKCNCPNCTSPYTNIRRHNTSASGIKSYQLQCKDCGKYFQVSPKDLENRNK